MRIIWMNTHSGFDNGVCMSEMDESLGIIGSGGGTDDRFYVSLTGILKNLIRLVGELGMCDMCMGINPKVPGHIF